MHSALDSCSAGCWRLMLLKRWFILSSTIELTSLLQRGRWWHHPEVVMLYAVARRVTYVGWKERLTPTLRDILHWLDITAANQLQNCNDDIRIRSCGVPSLLHWCLCRPTSQHCCWCGKLRSLVTVTFRLPKRSHLSVNVFSVLPQMFGAVFLLTSVSVT